MEHRISISRKGIRDMLRTPISRSLWVGIGSSFLLRLAGAATGLLVIKYLNTYVAQANGASFMDPNILSVLTGIYFATELLGAPVLGALSDRWGRKPLLLAGPLFGALAVQIHPLTTIILVIAIARLFEGLAAACNIPSTLGFLTDETGGNAALRGRVMGIFEIASLVGLVLGPVLGTILWEGVHLPAQGLDVPGLEVNGLRVVSLIYLGAMALIYFFIVESRPVHAIAAPPTADAEMGALVAVTASGPDTVMAQGVLVAAGGGNVLASMGAELRARVRGYRDLLRLPRLINFVPAWLVVNAVLGLWFNHVAGLLTRPTRNPAQLLEGGYTLGQVSQLFIGFGITFGIGILFWSAFYARIRKTSMMLAAVCGALAVMIIGFLINNQVFTAVPFAPAALGLGLFASLFVMSGFTPVALAYLADISEDQARDRGMVMGLYSVLLGVGQLGGALLGGPFIGGLHLGPLDLAGLGFNGLLLVTGLLAVGGIAVVLHLRRVSGD